MDSFNKPYSIITKEGINLETLDVSKHNDVVVEIPANIKGSLCLEVIGSGNLNIEIHVGQYSEFKYLWLNHSDGELKVEERLLIQDHASLIASYGEMTSGNHKKNTIIQFVGERSRVDLKGAVVAFNALEWKVMALHQAKRSIAHVDCNAIVLDNAKLHLEVAGKIEKGQSGSETHQMSRIMNLGENSKGIVYPMLLIDENDVAASHAASVGQPNEEHLYYLQSRGLSRVESLKLITMGYLMPIVEGIDSQEIKEALTLEISKKVNQQWL